jgi:peroxiredoxin
MSSLVKLNQQFQSQGVETVGLSIDPDDSVAAVREFVKNFEVPFRIGWASSEVAATLMSGRYVLPQTLVVSRSGKIVKRLVGFNPTFTAKQVRQAVKTALIEEPEAPAND